MAKQDTSTMTLSYIEEVTFGAAPATGVQDLRFTTESLAVDTDSVMSDEIRDDGQVPDVIRTGLRGAGDFSFEFSYGTYDDMMAAALLSSGFAGTQTCGPVQLNATASSGRIEEQTPANGFAGFTAGSWCGITAFTNQANNGFKKIKAVDVAEDYIDIEDGWTLVDETGSGDEKVVQLDQIVNGRTLTTFSFQKYFSQLTGNKYSHLHGFAVETFSFNAQNDQIMTGTFGFLGKIEEPNQATGFGGSATEATTTQVMNGVDHVFNVYEDYWDEVAVQSSVELISFNFSVKNNLRSREVCGTLGAADEPGLGRLEVTGKLTLYFEDETFYEKYTDWQESSLAFLLRDTAGNTYIFDFPRVRFNNARRVAGGVNQDIIVDVDFTAYRHETEDVTFKIARQAAA